MESKKVIKICGVPYTITEHDDIFNADASHFGMIDPVGCEIRINKSLKDPSKQETLCHEITHGILIHIGRTDLSDDETFVQSLGNAIFQSFMPKVEERPSYERPAVLRGVAANSNMATSYTPCVLRDNGGNAQI